MSTAGDIQADAAGTITNEQLKAKLREHGLSPAQFARKVGVELKTVRRWLANAHASVREDNARQAAKVLHCTPHDLWPTKFPHEAAPIRPDTPVPFSPTVYASRTQVPLAVWQDHFTAAQNTIDILVFAATFLFDTLDGFTTTLTDAARRGVQVRFLVGDPHGDNMTLRGEEEGIGESVKARSHNSVELLRPYTATPGFDVRTHQTTLYTSIFRVDTDMIINFHIYGSPGRDNPVMIFSRNQEPRLWATFERAFNQVWEAAAPLASPVNPPL
ncbi:helix-turn-helix domain-containing protein [Mycobacteroides abscessus]|uniref:helix-turn-helix domain-containing protein n=1 Tax=Mycobacteroides abscessus TaxID=36809 RepID=UPI000C25B525|nr:helix-turn-helix domain-containing protein [Mycobacteroides abscessus]